MTEQPLLGVLVLIVAYRADEHLKRCLNALGEAATVTVIDNCASEQTRRITAAAGATYVESLSNVGFAAGVNIGLNTSWNGDDDVLLLNPDALISFADVLALQSTLHDETRRLGAVGPRLIGETDQPQRADWPLPSPLQMCVEAIGVARIWRGRRFIVGAVLLLRADALHQVGNFDERYFLYAEEADWQMRAQRAGWAVAVADTVTAVHVGSASSSNSEVRERLFHGSAETFARRWYGQSGWQVMRAAAFVAALRRTIVGSPESREINRRTMQLYLRGPLKVAEASRRHTL